VEEAERAERAGYLALEALLRDTELGRWDGDRVRWREAPKPPPDLPPARRNDLLKAGIVPPLPIPLGDRCAVPATFPFLPGSPRLELEWAFLEERRKVGSTTFVALRVYLPLSPEEGVQVVWPVRIRGWYGRVRRPGMRGLDGQPLKGGEGPG